MVPPVNVPVEGVMVNAVYCVVSARYPPLEADAPVVAAPANELANVVFFARFGLKRTQFIMSEAGCPTPAAQNAPFEAASPPPTFA